eukprot:1946130-Pyramimonas_sp.AAC.2
MPLRVAPYDIIPTRKGEKPHKPTATVPPCCFDRVPQGSSSAFVFRPHSVIRSRWALENRRVTA